MTRYLSKIVLVALVAVGLPLACKGKSDRDGKDATNGGASGGTAEASDDESSASSKSGRTSRATAASAEGGRPNAESSAAAEGGTARTRPGPDTEQPPRSTGSPSPEPSGGTGEMLSAGTAGRHAEDDSAGTSGGGSPAAGGPGNEEGGAEAEPTFTEPSGEVGVLGKGCPRPGALACAGNHQKLTLVCGADGLWDVNATCSGTQMCSTTTGAAAGSCQEPVTGCVGQPPGHRFCSGAEVQECDGDAVFAASVETCPVSCVDGRCSEADPCPSADGYVIDCAGDCAENPSDVSCPEDPEACPRISEGWDLPFYRGEVTTAVVRTPSGADACECSAPDDKRYGMRYFLIGRLPILPEDSFLRVSVAEPWQLLPHYERTACNADVEGTQCLLSGALEDAVPLVGPADAPPRNVTLELVDRTATCP